MAHCQTSGSFTTDKVGATTSQPQRAATAPTPGPACSTRACANSNGLRAAVAARTARTQSNAATSESATAPPSPARVTAAPSPPPPPPQENGSPDFDAHAESNSCYYDPSDAGTVVMSYSGTRAGSTASVVTAPGAVQLQPHAPLSLSANDVAEVSEFEEFDAIASDAADVDMDVDMAATSSVVPVAAAAASPPIATRAVATARAPKRKSIHRAARARLPQELHQEASRKKKHKKGGVMMEGGKNNAGAPPAVGAIMRRPGALGPTREPVGDIGHVYQKLRDRRATAATTR